MTGDAMVNPTMLAGEQALARTWAEPRGLWGFLTTVDAKKIGKRYIVTGLIFFVLGGLGLHPGRHRLYRLVLAPSLALVAGPCSGR